MTHYGGLHSPAMPLALDSDLLSVCVCCLRTKKPAPPPFRERARARLFQITPASPGMATETETCNAASTRTLVQPMLR